MTGLVIIGGSRSGTSMTAGLFAKHGVWFGKCVKPNRLNRKGFFENAALKRVWTGRERVSDFRDWWAAERLRQGHTGDLWAAKSGAERWPTHWAMVEDVKCVVHCYRDRESIEASRRKAGFKGSGATAHNWRIMGKHEDDPRVVKVWTPDFIRGDFRSIIPAFDMIGVEFDEVKALSWVDPDMWHGK